MLFCSETLHSPIKKRDPVSLHISPLAGLALWTPLNTRMQQDVQEALRLGQKKAAASSR